MPTQIKPKETNTKILLGGAWLLSAVVCFAVGWSASQFQAPEPVPAQANAKSATGSAAEVSAGTDSRVGGVFAADSTGKTGTAPTIGEITGGQPLDVWLKRVMEQDDELFRMQNFMKLLDSLNSVEDVETALKVVMANGGGRGRGPGFGGRFTEISMLMSKFVHLDPKSAMAFSTKLEGGEKFMATSSALRTWTRVSPDAALQWAQTEGANVSMDFGRGQFGGDQQQQEGQPKDNFALLSVVSQLAKTDLEKALTTAKGMEMGRFGDRMVETLAAEVVSQRGADAAKTLADGLEKGPFRDTFIQQTAERLAGKDPEGTAKWVSGLESGDTKRRSLGRVVDSWARNDFAAASNYVSSLPVGPDSDSARNEIINITSRTDPKSAWNMVSTISDEERRDRAAVSVGRDLVRKDPQNGLATVQSTPNIKPEVIQQITTPQRDGGGGGFQFGGRPGGGGGGRGGR